MKFPERTVVLHPAASWREAAAQTSLRPWLAAWLGLPVLAIINGAIRDITYKRAVTDLTAHQVSTATLLAGMTAYMRELDRRWPLKTSQAACTVGGTWAVLAIAFEFGFGHYVTKESWQALLHAYNVTDGQVWAAVPLWTLLGPEMIRRLHDRRRASA